MRSIVNAMPLPLFYDTADALACLSQNQQLFCSVFVHEGVIFFATDIRNLCHPTRKSPPCMDAFQARSQATAIHCLQNYNLILIENLHIE
jgi:hypothetical protein